MKRKCNLLNDKQKHEIISYAKENPKLTQQIADNLTFKWDLPIKRRIVGDILNQKEFYESDNEGLPSRKRHRSMSVELKQFEKVYDFPFSMSLRLSPNYRLHRGWRFNEGALYSSYPLIRLPLVQ